MQSALIAQLFQTADEPTLDSLPILLIKVIRPQVLIGLLARQDMVDDDQNRMTDRHQGIFGSPTCL